MRYVTKTKINLMLTVTFVLVFVTGILLHLKKHGLVLEPREVLKVAHYAAGFLMVGCALCHVLFTSKVFRIVGASRHIFFFFTCLLEAALFLVFVTGVLKLLSPVMIPHLGLVHYWLGIVMTVSASVHLFTVLPWLVRNLKNLRRK
ncbi:MAG: DUF4405 domain-containing protein [Alloprevotella sp.]